LKKRRLDWLFWVGVAYLAALLLFSAFGTLRHPVSVVAKRGVYDVGIRGDGGSRGLTVRVALRESPAAAAGIEAGDIVTQVDGEPVGGLGTLEVEDLFLGPRGTSVSVSLLKGGTLPETVSLERSYVPDARTFMPPSREFWLGTDEQGRDVFSRLAFGARMSLIIGFSVQIIALVVGILMGTVGVFGPKWVSIPVLRLTDGMFAFPDILLAILIVGIWNKRFEAMIVALAITAWPAVARLVRTQIASLKDRDYVVASRALGGTTTYLVLKHILPHLWGILLAVAMIDVAAVILAESALSFLGIGIQAPTPSWGAMIESGRVNMNSYPMMLLWPCLILSLTIFALNFVGDGLRALADPKSG